MYAGAAIGVSHLVQATRAGGGYGFALVWAVVMVHLFKYPFFEFGHRYTAATGESLLVGYRRLGKTALLSYLAIVLCLSIPTGAVLTIVTAGMAAQIFAIDLTPQTWALILPALCVIVLASGGYPLLDKVMKLMMVFLAACTFVAVAAALRHGQATAAGNFIPAEIWNVAGISFLVALMGWMPTPVDCSAWPSLWMIERIRETGHRPTLREALFDFRLGYGVTFVMALAFLTLGALVMFGTGEQLAGGGVAFAAQFVGMYTNTLGAWSRPVIIAAAFLAMMSTMLTVFDAYPRVLTACCRLAWSAGRHEEQRERNDDSSRCRAAGERIEPCAESGRRLGYWGFMTVMIAGALLIFHCLTAHMRTLVDAVTTLAFVSAPVLGFLNWRVVKLRNLPEDARPPKWLHVLCWLGLLFLSCFTILFLVVRFGYGQ